MTRIAYVMHNSLRRHALRDGVVSLGGPSSPTAQKPLGIEVRNSLLLGGRESLARPESGVHCPYKWKIQSKEVVRPVPTVLRPSHVQRSFDALIDAVGEIGCGNRCYELDDLFLIELLAESVDIVLVNSARIPG
jgi:hypothetical protein